METNVNERELGWEDVIENDGEDFILLQPGNYEFKVKKIDRARFNGSDKMPACPQANITLEIIDPATGKSAIVMTRLLLHTRTEWTLAAFFRSIGMRKKGEALQPKWMEAVGQTGTCKIKHREYNGEFYNEVYKFLPKDEETTTSGGFNF